MKNILVAVCLAFVTIGCAAKVGSTITPKTVALKVGTYTEKFTKVALEAQTIVINGNKMKLISDDVTAKSMVVFARVGNELQRTGAMLDAFNQLEESQKAFEAGKISQSFTAAKSLLRSALLIAGASDSLVLQISALMDSLDILSGELDNVFKQFKGNEEFNAGYEANY